MISFFGHQHHTPYFVAKISLMYNTVFSIACTGLYLAGIIKENIPANPPAGGA